ncbi:hypothetical protein CEXT_691031 [Caerostris extrusa]|uniref:Uncharacterized protein n=1 Tax=Caerostris extrusa TaxID=172846 RepID=A0AAV4XUA0_CAEEX|nr:hypothetical protein CEXT_691031 [Caerostris extrusa]
MSNQASCGRAPELLKMPNPPLEGTQKGDVYSFAVIAHEIVVRQGVFYTGNDASPKEIVENVMYGTKSAYRPLIDLDNCDEGVIQVIKSAGQRSLMTGPTSKPSSQS